MMTMPAPSLSESASRLMFSLLLALLMALLTTTLLWALRVSVLSVLPVLLMAALTVRSPISLPVPMAPPVCTVTLVPVLSALVRVVTLRLDPVFWAV